MRFTLSRRRYTVSTPTIRMSPRLPWPIRWLLTAMVLGFCAWLALWVFEFGRNVSGLPSTQKEVQRLQKEIEQLREEQKSNTSPANSLLLAERATQEKLIERVRILEAENQALSEDLAFFQKLIPSKSKDSLSVRSLEAKRKQANQLDWEFLLIQTQKEAAPTTLRIEVIATGLLNSNPWTSAQHSQPLLQTVQQSTRLAGTLPIPDKLVLKSLTVKIYDGKTLRSSQSLNNF